MRDDNSLEVSTSEVSTPENESDVDRRGMRKFFYRAGAVLFLLMIVGGIVATLAGSSIVQFHVGFAIMCSGMCSGVLLGLAFLYESLEPDERLGMRIGMYAAVGFFASLVLLMFKITTSYWVLIISIAPLVILGPIDLLCCYFAQRTAAGLSQGGDLAQDPLAEPLLNPTATDSAVLGAAQTQEAAARLSQGGDLAQAQGSLTQSLLALTATDSAAPGAVPVPVSANQAGATSNLFGQPADQEGRPDSTIELTPQKPNP